jgi:hypothetical protein
VAATGTVRRPDPICRQYSPRCRLVSVRSIIRRLAGLVLAVLLLGVCRGGVRADQATPAPGGIAMVVATYADGRHASIRVQGSRGTWTSVFPRIPSWTGPPDQLPVTAINYVCALTAEGVTVKVSVYRGSAHQLEDPIATVNVTPTAPVVVDQLKSVGVEPVTLSLTTVTPPHLTPPATRSASPLLAVVGVEASESPVPQYLITLRNTSAKAVRSLGISASRDGVPGLSGGRTGHEGAALIAPNDKYTFDVPENAGAPGRDGRPTPPIAFIMIAYVLWADGSHDGDPAAAARVLVFDYGDLVQVRRVMLELERAQAAGAAATPATVRAALDALSIEPSPELIEGAQAYAKSDSVLSPSQVASAIRASLQQVKKTFLDDVTASDDGRAAPGAFEGWLNSMVTRCQRWSALLSK